MGIFDKIKSNVTNVGRRPSASSSSFAPANPSPPLEHNLIRYRKQRGINLGSWFTTEDWLATKLYASTAVDPKGSDYDLARGQNAKAAMEEHWDNWVTDSDWKWIKERGFNTVRLPIGYYHLAGVVPEVLKGTDYEKYADVYTGAWPRIVKAIETAGQYGIGVLVDFHAAPGSQNTDGHSGMSHGNVNFWQRSNLSSAAVALKFLASAVANYPHVVGLELLNEPKNSDKLQGWYERTLSDVRALVPPDFPIYVSDAWDTGYYAGWVGGRNDFLVLDYHLYRCFDEADRHLSGPQHADKLRNEFAHRLAEWSQSAKGSIIIGEWSAGLDDSCLPHDTPAGERDAHKRAWVAAQLEIYDRHAAGYFFWTLKTDRDWDAGWSAYNAAQAEILPQSLVLRSLHVPPEGARDAAAQQATDAHTSYWNANGGNPQPHIFHSAFTQGWNDAALFISTGEELGFVGQWSRARLAAYRQNGPVPAQWEWEHGFAQGVGACRGAAE